jgi:hypothetical protein
MKDVCSSDLSWEKVDKVTMTTEDAQLEALHAVQKAIVYLHIFEHSEMRKLLHQSICLNKKYTNAIWTASFLL